VLGYEGNRAVLFEATGPLPRAALGQVIAMALTYHLRRRKAA
jgi:hypothetical protein